MKSCENDLDAIGEIQIEGDSIATLLSSIHSFLKRMHLNTKEREAVIVALLEYACYEHNTQALWANTINSILIKKEIEGHGKQR